MGHIISKEGFRVDPKNKQAILDLAQAQKCPTTLEIGVNLIL